VREVVGEPRAQYYSVTAEAVRNLASFLRETGWTCLYGIGMRTNTPEHAVAEAEYVAKTLGSRLQYFQIGNEVDLFSNTCAIRRRGMRRHIWMSVLGAENAPTAVRKECPRETCSHGLTGGAHVAEVKGR
jgi:hypothetical protein